ncbi:hypothetical protein [Actinoplanes sp. NPDC026619]
MNGDSASSREAGRRDGLDTACARPGLVVPSRPAGIPPRRRASAFLEVP